MTMKYLYYISYTRSRERYILDKTDLERMINALTAEEARKVLYDTDYGNYITPERSLEEIIEEEKKGTYDMLSKMGLERRVLDLLFLPADMLNLRVMLKEDLFGVKGEGVRVGRRESALRTEYAAEIEEAKKKEDPSELDDFLTGVLRRKRLEKAKEDKSLHSFLKKRDEKALAGSSEEELVELEDRFMKEARRRSEGLAPLFAHFMQKWRAERILRLVHGAKKAEVPSERIYESIKKVPAL